MGRHDDGCLMLVVVLLVYLVKVIIAIGFYILAALMTFATLIWLPLIFIVSLFDKKCSPGLCLVMWFAMANKFAANLFKD